MTILHPRLFLAICAGAGLIAFTPEWRRPPAELAAIDESAIGSSARRVARPPSQAADAGREARLAVAARPSAADERIDDAGSLASVPLSAIRPPPPEAALSDADLAAQFADADLQAPAAPRGVGMSPACCVRAESAAKLSPSREEASPTGAALPAQFAYADVPSAGPVISALSEIAPSPPAAAPAPDSPSPAPPLGSEAAILYNRGDVAGLAALAQAANDAAERSALEWASLRANPHPSLASLAAFLEAHPTWPSRGWIREREEAELAAHPEAPAKVAEFFAGGQPQTSAGKIAAAHAAKATGRSDEASQIIRALWRDGNFDALTEGVILRDFGASLQKDDHKYRADRLIYAGYVGAASRAAALAGPDVLALAEARIEAARAPMSAALLRAVPPALRDDPGLLFSRVQYARRAGRVYEAAVLLSLAPHDRTAVVSPDRWWSERKMIAAALLDLNEPRLAFEVCDGTVRPETSEAEVDADFHAGWIALRFLNDPALAAERFALAALAADAPLSIARAAYWQGRAAEAMGGSEAARGFYERAASEPIAYYGQLAAQRLGQTRLDLRAPKPAAEGDRRDEAVGAVAALYGDGLDDLAASLAFDAARQWLDEFADRRHGGGREAFRRCGDASSIRQVRPHPRLPARRGGVSGFRDAGLPPVGPLRRPADRLRGRAAGKRIHLALVVMGGRERPDADASLDRGLDRPAGRGRVRLCPPHSRPGIQHPAWRLALGSIDRGRRRVT